MFKPIPGNKKYIISLSQEIRDVDGFVVELSKSSDGKIEIEMYGKMVKVCPIWLSLLAHFEIYFTDPSFAKLLNVKFAPCNIKYFRPISSKFPIFIKPVTIVRDGKKYRVIPNYSRYATSADGKIFDISSNSDVKVSAARKKHNTVIDQYPSVYIHDPDKNGYRYVYVHRLVAMAWIKPPQLDFVRNPVVNHKDGNKENYVASNLEWCSFRDNSLHMYSIGLRSDNIPCRVRDFTTGKVFDFPSKSQAAEFMGISKANLNSSNLYSRSGRLVNNRYEFKLNSDKTPWFYENRKEKVKLGRYLITVVDRNNNYSYYYDLRDFKKEYSIWNVPNVCEILKVARSRYPELRFEFTDYYNGNDLQVYELKTGKITEIKSITKAVEVTKVTRARIRRCLKNGETWSYSGYAFRYKKDEPWEINFVKKDTPRNKPLEATNAITGEKLAFPSIRSANKFLGARDHYWLKNCIEQNVEYKGWRFRFISNVG